MYTSSLLVVAALAAPVFCHDSEHQQPERSITSEWLYPNNGNLTVHTGDVLALSWWADRAIELDIIETNSKTHTAALGMLTNDTSEDFLY